MTDPLNADLKLQRAEEHFNAFKMYEQGWIEQQNKLVVIEPYSDPPFDDAPPGTLNLMLGVERIIPLADFAPLIVGDCLQNLRAALDHLANQLVISQHHTPDENTAFPLFEDRIVQHGKKPHVRTINVSGGIHADALAIIEAAQPYNRVDDPTLHPLWILNELSNIDKHRLPVLVGGHTIGHRIYHGGGGSASAYFKRPGTRAARLLEEGTPLSVLAAADPQMDVRAEVGFGIAFGIGEVCQEEPVTDVLKSLFEAVRSVISALRCYT